MYVRGGVFRGREKIEKGGYKKVCSEGTKNGGGL